MGKDPTTYEKCVSINEFEQKPVDKYEPLIQRTVLSKPKTVSVQEMMDARLEKKREKRTEKRTMLENKLVQNIKETNNLKNLNKKRKVSM